MSIYIQFLIDIIICYILNFTLNFLEIQSLLLFLLFYTYFLFVILRHVIYLIFFFFQAEDGIRDIGVTGVQTCALPIWRWSPVYRTARAGRRTGWRHSAARTPPPETRRTYHPRGGYHLSRSWSQFRSEESRVGKERRSWGGPDH